MVLCIFVLAVIVVGLAVPRTGQFVLVDEVCDTVVIWTVCILIIGRTAVRSGNASVSGKEYSSFSGRDTIRVEYYRNTGRVVCKAVFA